jgi:hypothetical protein
MKLQVTDTINYPVDQVFPVFRDKMPELVPFLDAIGNIDVLSRETGGDAMHVVSIWTSTINFPGPIEKMIPKGTRSYKDIATWHADQLAVEWRIEVPIVTEAVNAHGRNHFEAKGDKTVMHIVGEIDINPAKLKGIPTIVAKRIVPTITKFVLQNVEKNLVQVNRGVERFLAAQGKK